MRVLEVGCGTGVVARAVLRRLGNGHVLAIDRSAKAVAQAIAGSTAELTTGHLEFRCVTVEKFVLAKGDRPYDLAVAIRVGALDGRHPEAGHVALSQLRRALVKPGRLFIGGGDPLTEINLR